MKRVLPFFPVAATLGLLLTLREPTIPYFIILFSFILFCLIHRSIFKKMILLIMVTFLCYYFIGSFTLKKQVSAYIAGEQIVRGTIHTIPVIDGDSFSMRIKGMEKELIEVQYFLVDENEQKTLKKLSPGDRCNISGLLSPPTPPTNFAQFDYQRYLQEQQIFWILRPNKNGLVCQQDRASGYFLQRWRQMQMIQLEHTINPELAGIMIALLFGERTIMESDVIDAYQKLGVIHLLAVSGLHVGMIVAALFYLLIRIGLTRERAMEALILFLPLYIFIAGAAPSVIRASCMTMVILLCLRFKTRVSPLAGIIFVYMVYLLIKPFVLFHLGFQLSFLISFGLLLSASFIYERYSHPVLQLLAVTVLSQIFSMPIILYHVYEFSWISIPLNIVYIPFITLCVLPMSVVAYVFNFFIPTSVNIPLLFLELVVPFAHTGLTNVAAFKWSTFIIGKPPIFLVFLLYIVIVYGCISWEGGARKWWLNPLCCLFILIAGQVGAPYVDSRVKVTMLDVGQGDSYLLELPYRKEVYLIDTGGTISYLDEEWRKRRRSFDVGANIVVPALKERGIRRIHRLVLTHGHIDHIGGAEALSQSIHIDRILYGKGPIEGEQEREIVNELMNQGTKFTFVKEGDQWQSGSSQFAILSPTGSEIDLNARSIVLYAVLEEISFLFTGDLEMEGERRLISDYPNLRVNILKIGHHGSRTSTTEEFLNHLSPEASFISSGRNNRFNHPHPEVVDRLNDHGIHIWRSDQEAITLFMKNGHVNVKKVMN